jgi:hypothetical protein
VTGIPTATHLEYFQVPGSRRVLYPCKSVEEFERRCRKKARAVERKKPAEVKRKMPGVSSKSKKVWRV